MADPKPNKFFYSHADVVGMLEHDLELRLETTSIVLEDRKRGQVVVLYESCDPKSLDDGAPEFLDDVAEMFRRAATLLRKRELESIP